jgi:LPXTG-motif cell wall-anchored protein
MKKMLGVAAVGVIAVMSLASVAGAAQPDVPPQTAPPSPGACVFAVNPATSATFPVNVTVSGTAPTGVHIMIFVGGTKKAEGDVVGGAFSFPNISVPDSATAVQANYTYGNKNAYTTICADASNSVEIRVKAESATLAFTGSSSNTGTYVLVGVAAVVLGLVLVVGVRRRASVRG